MFSAVLDTCVLYPMYLRDTLLRVASEGLYQPLLTQEILVELHGVLSRHHGARLASGVTGAINDAFHEAMVTGHAPLIDAMTNDPKDRHVLAAAVRSNAGAIVTENLEDFPADSTSPFSIRVIHPDDFLMDQHDRHPERFLHVLHRQLRGYSRPKMTMLDLAERFERSSCPQLATLLRGL